MPYAKTPGGWNRVGYTALYNECGSKGHHPYYHSSNFRRICLYCPDCERFWRLEIDRLTWKTLEEFLRGGYAKPPADPPEILLPSDDVTLAVTYDPEPLKSDP